MGGCCSNCDKQAYVTIEPPPMWAKAVFDGSVDGCRYLHMDDPGLLEAPVTAHQQKAIHIAVQKQYDDLLEYLLKNGADYNSPIPRSGNTPLHVGKYSTLPPFFLFF